MIGVHTDEYLSGFSNTSTFVTHSYSYANNYTNDGVFESETFKDIIEQCYNDTASHFNTNVSENIIIISFTNAGSNNILYIRVSQNHLEGQKNGTYFQYAQENCMRSQIEFTATLSNDKYTISGVKYKNNTRNLIALSTQNTISYTPTSDYHPATKKYVDDIVGNIETLLSAI